VRRCLCMILTAQKRGSHGPPWATAPQKRYSEKMPIIPCEVITEVVCTRTDAVSRCCIPLQSVRDLWRVKWHRDRLFSELIWLSFRQCCTLIFISLLLFDGQGGEIWKPSKKSFLFPKRTSVPTQISKVEHLKGPPV